MAAIAEDIPLDFNAPVAEIYRNRDKFKANILQGTEFNPARQYIEQSFKRTFVPAETFPDGVSAQTGTLIGRPGFGKTALARAIASFLANQSRDGWLWKTKFNPPLIIWSNSLIHALHVAQDQMEADTNYVLMLMDDAIRHGSSKRVMTRAAVTATINYAEIRHILQDQCGMKPGGTLSMFWMTQRWKDLTPFFRASDWLIFKGVDNDRREQKALKSQVGEKAFNWLLKLVRYIVEFKEYSMLQNVLTQPAWLNVQGTQLRYNYDDLLTIDDMGGFHRHNIDNQAVEITGRVYDYVVKHHRHLLHDAKMLWPVLRSVAREGYDQFELYANVDYCIQDALRQAWQEGYFKKNKGAFRVCFCLDCEHFWIPKKKKGKPKQCPQCRSSPNRNSVRMWVKDDPDETKNNQN